MSDDKQEEYSAEWWAKEIGLAEKELDEKWRKSGDSIVNRFLDERSSDDAGQSNAARKYNIFWTNTLILKSALYATPPKPVVKRQYDDAKDDIARTAALMLQRILTFDLEKQNSSSHNSFSKATEDRLIPGLGQVWPRLEVETEKFQIPAVMDPLGNEIVAAAEGERIVKQQVHMDYVHWRDFVWSPARTWDEVWWVARRVWMKKRAFKKRFGADKAKEVEDQAATYKTEHGYPKGFEKGRVEVYEIWCEESNKVYFIHKTLKMLLDERDDPLQLDEFFPCPQPLLATHTTNNVIPRPDYVMVQDQYSELDDLNDRIATLTKALRVVGAYDGKNTSLQKMLTGNEFDMIPVDNWAALGDSGGIRGLVEWFPVEQIANVLDKLTIQRAAVVGQIYELTGISDIMRGGSNPRETLGAQKLKAQYSSVRLRLTQQDVSVFVCAALRIKAEIICKHFDPAQIIKQSQIEQTESAAMAPQAIELLKDYEQSQYRIEISEESLSMADYTAEREMRVAYLTAVGQFLSQAAAMVVSMPSAMPYVIRMIMWVTASFRGSDDIETVLDEAAKSAQNLPPTPPEQEEKQEPPEPDPRIAIAAKAQADTQSKIATDTNKANLDLRNDLAILREEHKLNPEPQGGNNGD